MSAAGEPTVEQPISRAVVLDARFNRVRAAERVEAREIRILPGHAAGMHVHNGPVVGNILEGSVVYQIEGEPERILQVGDVFFEPEGARIARFDATADGVRFLGYFILGPDEQPEIAFPEP
jgi:quercetin dioxygenase-like cupin family protein